MNIIDVTTAKTSELVAFFNAHVAKDKQVSRFADRKTAEARVMRLIQEKGAEVAAGLNEARHQVNQASKVLTKAVKAAQDLDLAGHGAPAEALPAPEAPAPVAIEAKREPTAPVKKDTATGETKPAKAKKEKAPKEPKERKAPRALTAAERKSASAGIAASWTDPDVYAARLTRQGTFVTVGKKTHEYNSVRAAFEALGLPISKHIRFRMKLKEAGEMAFQHDGKEYHFQIAEASE